MMRSFLFFFLTWCLLVVNSYAQELNFNVVLQTQSSIQSFTNSPEFYRNLESTINDFINKTKWTEDEFRPHERIKGNIQITITEELSPTYFRGEMVWKTERPVFNSNYSSQLISLIDKDIEFSYSETQPLYITTNTFYDNLSSILSYYVYLTLGMDYDSFSINGGEKFFNLAQEIITSLNSVAAGQRGWTQTGTGRRNRFWLIENILSTPMRQFRQAFYEYHRLALDNMHADTDKSRAILLSTLTAIGQADKEYPSTYLIQIFGDAKKNEIVDIFLPADKGQRSKVQNIMVGMDATKKQDYITLE
jgi:hypothetical protein